MREGAKKRLIGAVVVVALAVIFVPMLFEPESLDSLPPVQESIPRPPAFDAGGKAEVFLGPQNSGVGGLTDGGSRISQPLTLPPAAGPAPVGGGRGNAPAESAAAQTRPGAAAGAAGVKPEATPPLKPGKAETAKAAVNPALVPPRGANDGMPSWVIQVASVATPEGAAELEGKLRASGFSAFVEKADVNGKVYYRVRVGPELDRGRAEQTAARLRERHKVNTLITNYP